MCHEIQMNLYRKYKIFFRYYQLYLKKYLLLIPNIGEE